MRVTHLFWDIAGVLCRFDQQPRLDGLARLSGLPMGEVRSRIYDSGFVRDGDTGRYSAGEMTAEIARLLGVAADHARLRELWARAFVADPPVLAVAEASDGGAERVAFSNNDPLVEEALPDVLGGPLTRWFDRMLFTWSLGVDKRTPDCYRLALERCGCAADEVLLVDDSATVLEVAAAAGLQVFAYRGPDDLEALRLRIAEISADPLPRR